MVLVSQCDYEILSEKLLKLARNADGDDDDRGEFFTMINDIVLACYFQIYEYNRKLHNNTVRS